jgi:F420-dependent oxidoreductase-like protein
MKLGMSTGYWGSGPPAGAAEAVEEADRLGFDSVWTAEAYGSDALTPLAWWGARTSHIKLGTAIMQLSARTPAATAMAAMTMDHLSQGRFVLGIGASGPQVVEGWYGQPYPKPLARTRSTSRSCAESSEEVTPLRSRESTTSSPIRGHRLGKPLKSTIHPYRERSRSTSPPKTPRTWPWRPRWRRVAAAVLLAQRRRLLPGCLADGFAASGEPGKADRFEIAAPMTIVPGDDVEQCADAVRPMLALYAGGMGARGANFHFDVFARMSWEAEASKIQELYLAGRKAEAIASVPLAMVEDIALVGPMDKIRGELERWRDTCITTFLVSAPAQLLPAYADLVAG